MILNVPKNVSKRRLVVRKASKQAWSVFNREGVWPAVITDNFVTKLPHVGEELMFGFVLDLPLYLERIKISF